MGKLSTAFDNIIQKITDTTSDFTTLEVTTISGEIRRVVNSDGKFQAKELLKEINGADGTTTQDLQIIAHTHIDFDHDTVNFVKSELNKEEKELYTLHTEAIENAKASRQEMLSFIGEVTASLVKT